MSWITFQETRASLSKFENHLDGNINEYKLQTTEPFRLTVWRLTTHIAPLTSKRCILYIYPTNKGTEYFKHALYSPLFSLQNAVCFIMLTCLVPVLFTFYTQDVLKLKKNNSGAKWLTYMSQSNIKKLHIFGNSYIFCWLIDVRCILRGNEYLTKALDNLKISQHVAKSKLLSVRRKYQHRTWDMTNTKFWSYKLKNWHVGSLRACVKVTLTL